MLSAAQKVRTQTIPEFISRGIWAGIGFAIPDRMASINSFRDLLVWQKSVDLAVNCHRIAKRFPRDEQPALGYQVRKSSLSIPSNVAEGFSRHSTAFYVQHLWTAHASGAELETQLINGLVRSLERGR